MNTLERNPDSMDSPAMQPALVALLQQALDFFAIVHLPDFTVESVSPQSHPLVPFAPSERGIERPLADFLTDRAASRMLQDALPVVARGRVWSGLAHRRTARGNPAPTRLLIAGWSHGEAPPERALVAGIDRSAQDELQVVFAHEQLLLHAIMDNVPDAIAFKDREGRFVRVSTAKARKLGNARPLDILGRTDHEYFGADYARAIARDEAQVIATGRPVLDREEQELWPDGHTTWALASRYPLRDLRGTIVGTLGISRDITARKSIEAQLQLAQKMESIGRLAAGVAHEVNTPTQFISDNTHFLLDAFNQITHVLAGYRRLRDLAAPDPKFHDAVAAIGALEAETEIDYLVGEIPRTLEQTADGIARISRIVRSLKEFSHPNSPEKRPANLNHTIETAVAVSRHEWKLVADVVTELDPALPLVPCVLDEFNQIMLNLIVNAAHAIGDVVAEKPGERGRITLRSRVAGDSVVIEVEDTGTGIPAAVQNRVFEPFFTTKTVGKGTGQGLAIVHTFVVKKHNGTIGFTTEPGRGTTFRFTLPIHPRENAADTHAGP